jgi:hypothetical protein
VAYYIRVLGTKLEQPDLKYLRNSLSSSKSRAVLKLETGTEESWKQLVLAHPSGTEIAVIDYNPVVEGELVQDELNEFFAESEHYQPTSAARWLREYLPGVKTI